MNDSTYDSYEKIRTDIIKFNNDKMVQKLEKYYGTKSFLEILGVSRKELSHSKFLSWLFNPREDHKLEEFALKKLLELITIDLNGKNQDIKSIEKYILTDSYELSNILIEIEKAINKDSRLDILIQGEIIIEKKLRNFKIIIENKVTSLESKDQTQRYFDFFERDRKENDILIYLYLTSISTLELIELSEPECKCKEFIQINYQSIVDQILEPALDQNINDKINIILRDYIRSLSQLSFSIDNNNYEEGLIMAIGNEERELLSKFWESNKQLIMASLYAISNDPTQEKDIRDDINIELKSINSSGKDKSSINIYYKSEIVFNKILKSDIGLKTINLLFDKNLLSDDNFEEIRTNKSSSFLLLKRLDEITETEKKYGKYKYESNPELTYKGEEYFVARNWGINNIGKFINFIQSIFPDVKYEIVE
jgi:hypothetical protein